MALPLWISNLIAYSLQIAILASAGTLLACLFRLRVPRVSLIYWQILLLACLFLPALQSWKHPVLGPARLAPAVLSPAVESLGLPASPKPTFRIPEEAVALILAAGACLRLMWLALGFFRLRVFLRKSQRFSEKPLAVQDMQRRMGIHAPVFLSDEIDSPITFGVRAPAVILPPSFHEMSEPCQKAIVCHELLHVRRRDWALIVVEEIIRSIYWFHPAIWWLLGRIHLSREQAVDHDVIQLTGNRQPYLDSLLEIARAHGRPRAVPAPLFLSEHHLVQRVALLLKEVSMSRSRLIISLFGISVLLTGTVRLAAGWFPLTGAPVINQQQAANPEIKAPQGEPIKVGGNVQESRLIRRVEPTYPELAKRARISGRVILVVTVNEEGQVWDIKVVSGHPLLNDAAISAVRQWQYSPTLLNGMPVPVIATVTVIFNMMDDNDLMLTMDKSGNLKSPFSKTDDPDVMSKILQATGTIRLAIVQATPIQVAESVIRDLLKRGVQRIQLVGPYSLYQGRLFYQAREGISAPELALDRNRLGALAAASQPAGGGVAEPIVYSVYINEFGEILGLERLRGPAIPEVERELARTRVNAPGRIGVDPVPVQFFVEIQPK